MADTAVRRGGRLGEAMQGWLRVDAEGVRTKRQLEPWVTRGLGYARSLPPKG